MKKKKVNNLKGNNRNRLLSILIECKYLQNTEKKKIMIKLSKVKGKDKRGLIYKISKEEIIEYQQD